MMLNAQYLPRVVALVTHLRKPDTSSRMAEIVQEVIPEYRSRAHVDVVETTLAELHRTAKELEVRDDIDLIICSGATASYLRRHITTTILSIRMGEYDLIRALDIAKARSTRVGIVSFQKTHAELDAMASLFTVDLRQVTYTNFEEVRLRIHQLIEDGYKVIVGSPTVVEVAEAAGAHGVLALTAEAVRRTLDEALAICRSRVQALIQQQRLNAVLRNLSDGVIAVDADGLVQSINPRMSQLLGIPHEKARERSISTLLPELDIAGTLRRGEHEESQLIRIGGRLLVVNLTPIIEQGKADGMVISCQETNTIQRADRRIRSQSRGSQFTARYHFEQLIGQATNFRAMLMLARRYAATSSTVLITGESGTGKELLAQSLHNASARQGGPFVAINCAAFPENLLESELFGYEEGAFTGSRKGGKPGLIEAAHTGTLFLDEIGDMPLPLQTRLLRVLQEREVLRLGASEPTQVDIRIVAATHRDLSDLIAAGHFREDLYYRLNILRLAVPALRERVEDIPLLARSILDRLPLLPAAIDTGRLVLEQLMPHLEAHRWPGNIRELENLVERAALSPQSLGDGPGESSSTLQALFPELFPRDAITRAKVGGAPATDLRSISKASEIALVQCVVEACNGDLDEAARRLGISRTTLWRRLRTQQQKPAQ